MIPGKHRTSISRRTLLKTAAAGGLIKALPRGLSAQSTTLTADWRSAVLLHLASLSRPDGGYAWEDQEASHLTPTFAVVGSYRLLRQSPPQKARVADFIRTHHPSRLKKLEQEHHEFELQQIQGLLWLGEDASEFRERALSWKKPTVYLKQYEQHGYPIFRHELAAIACRDLLRLPLNDLSTEFTEYLDVRRRANGSFNNTPAADGGDGHVLNTWWGLEALHMLGRGEEMKAATIAWLRACQLGSGGFTYQPKPQFGGIDDVTYTWAAVRALKQLGAVPADARACLAYLHSLSNADGGFGDRPGWASNPMATYYALDALDALGELASAPAVFRPAPPRTALPPDLRVFSIQLEAHGRGSPAEAVDLARALRIHLWGAKNAAPGWIAGCQALADKQHIAAQFFVSNEEYGTWVNVPGLGTYSHTSDILAPSGVSFGASLSNEGVVSWEEFRQRRLVPLVKADGRLVWQFGENEALVRMYLDDSLQRGGFAAISTYHFGNPDFTNSEPFLMRYRGRIPFIALQDSHGNEPWWFADMTTGFRTVFLATEPTWEGWLNALQRNWVVAIRHDAVSGLKTWMHGGSRQVVEFIREREQDWRWWDNPQIERPLVSMVAVRPKDEFEAARPKQGVTVRVRCAWENTAQGLPKAPIAELIRLTVDGQAVAPTLVVPRPARGAGYLDHYHLWHLADAASGRHSAVALVRELASKRESSRAIEFMV